MVFETNRLNSGWDGTYKGKPPEMCVDVWMIKDTGTNGKVIKMRVIVALVR